MKEIEVTGWLASSLGRNDEQPNIELAEKIASTGNKTAIGILVRNLSGTNNDIQSDCIKVLYETGYRNPELLADNTADFLALLKSKNNRLNWGAMIAIDCITDVNPDIILQNLSDIMSAVDKGSVITRDHGVSILIKLSKNRDYSEFTLPLLFEQLKTCPVNQLAMYAENALPVISGGKRAEFTAILESRMGELQKESQKSRIEKAIKKLNSGKVR